jgi:hypothetical protein
MKRSSTIIYSSAKVLGQKNIVLFIIIYLDVWYGDDSDLVMTGLVGWTFGDDCMFCYVTP